jgi:hypothetical protein
MTEYIAETLMQYMCLETGNSEFLLFQLWDDFESQLYLHIYSPLGIVKASGKINVVDYRML